MKKLLKLIYNIIIFSLGGAVVLVAIDFWEDVKQDILDERYLEAFEGIITGFVVALVALIATSSIYACLYFVLIK